MVTLRQAATLSLSLSEERLRLAHTSSEGHFRQALAHFRRHGVMGSALSIVCVCGKLLTLPPASLRRRWWLCCVTLRHMHY